MLVAACVPTLPPTAAPTPYVSAPTPAATSATPRRTDAPPSPTATPAPTPADPAAVSVTLADVSAIDGAPLAFAATADATGRVFVAGKDGRVWVLADGRIAAQPVLDLGGRVSAGGEQGLLGIALHPAFPGDPRLFADYTDTNGDTVVASYVLAGDGSGRFDLASETWILTVDQPFGNHNGGALAFGPDGMLYVSLGDGGGANDPLGSGQRLDTLLGKILRIDVDATGDAAYGIPRDNPFTSVAGARPEIWHLGLRNPWRFAFDPSTGDLWIGDVGQGAWEEVDVARTGQAGLNFGWDVLEGTHCHEPATGCDDTGMTAPVAQYGHDVGCTVIGGTVYRGDAQPLLAGLYLFADYCSGRLWAIRADRTGPQEPVRVGTAGSGIVAFGLDADGEILVANLDGSISRLVAGPR